MHINANANRELGNESGSAIGIRSSEIDLSDKIIDSLLGPMVLLTRTYAEIGYNSKGEEIILRTATETIPMQALVAASFPEQGLPENCRLVRSSIDFGAVLDQWGSSM